jgi:predicted HAD superfamily phosphohydrolase YqeG
MTAAYEGFADGRDLALRVAGLSARTAVLDIEPFVSAWNGSREALDEGLAQALRQLAGVPGLDVVCFATNSARRPSSMPDIPGIRTEYVAGARKPLQTAPYRDLPRPGVVIGDQVLTDGLLARRLGFTFLHYRPRIAGMPPGPMLLYGLGELLRPLVFGRRQLGGPPDRG